MKMGHFLKITEENDYVIEKQYVTSGTKFVLTLPSFNEDSKCFLFIYNNKTSIIYCASGFRNMSDLKIYQELKSESPIKVSYK